MFVVELAADDPFSSVAWGAVSPLLSLDHQYHRSSAARGGPLTAEIAVAGPENALWETLNWLRRPVEIRNEHGQRVWWGLVNEVRLTWAGLTIGVGLDSMVNRVAVAYSYMDANGEAVRGTTSWATNDDSIDRYGIKERLVSLGEGEVAAALARQSEVLKNRSTPNGVPSFGGGDPGANLFCIGWYETLTWQIFNRNEGRVEFADKGNMPQALGWALTSTQIGFAAGAIHHLGALLNALAEGDKVVVSGSSSNNGTRTITGPTSRSQQSYIATTISFDPTDDINDSASGLRFVESDSFIYISGSSNNSGYHLVETASADHLTTAEAVTGTIDTEAAGASITIMTGNKVEIAEAVSVTEMPGASVTLTLVGSRIGQSFTLLTPLTVAQVAVPVGKVGSPSDNFLCEIWSNSASAPSIALQAISVTGADLLANAQPWRWFTFNSLALPAGTYWIVVRRSGSVDPDDYYSLGMTDVGNATCKVWNGSAWISHPRSLYLPFRVWGSESTDDQIRQIIDTAGQFMAGVDVDATGISTNQYRDQDMTAYDEIGKLLDLGDSTGTRLLASVTPDRILRIYPEPAKHADGDRLQPDGTLRNVGGGQRQHGLLPAGEWVMLDGVPPSVNAKMNLSPLFVDEAGWRKSDPDIYEIQPKAAAVDDLL